jgi:hypothetical protein
MQFVMHKKLFLFFVILSFVGVIRAEDTAAEKSPWELSAALGGTQSANTGTAAETFYWGPSAKVVYEIADPLRARFGVKHTQNKFIYDGLGSLAKQSQTGFSPGLNWEITEKFSVDAEYTFRIGENDFLEHAGIIGFEWNPLHWLRLSTDFGYNRQSYRFPMSAEKISLRSWNLALETAFVLSKQIEIPVVFSIVSSRYNTNTAAYIARTATPGVTWRTADRKWSLSGSGILGSDSSNYNILGAEARIRFRATDHIMLRLSGSISHYSYTATKTNRSARAVTSAEAISPLGNSESFDVTNIGFEASYSY